LETLISTTLKAVGAGRTAGRAEAAAMVQAAGQAGADLRTECPVAPHRERDLCRSHAANGR
ncbi:MAG: hypothetical protein ABSF52_24635, partial [Syntrophobacteraceae bacterium]